jgi:3-oxoadipate CoA-transferase, alpha subunit
MTINKVIDSFDEAVADVFDGAVILIGGFGPSNGTPSYLIRALTKKGTKNLTIVANTPGMGRAPRPGPGAPPPRMIRKTPPNFDNAGLLIQNFQVRKAITAFPGNAPPGGGSPLHDQLRAGTLEVEVTSQGTLAERIRAARAGIPAFYTPTGPGTRLERGKEVREFNGRKCLLERAIMADFAFVRARRADQRGNLTYQGTSRNFNATMAGAARVTIAEIDELVPVGSIDPETVVTAGIYVQRVVPRPVDWKKGA